MLGWWCHLATWNFKVILVFNYALKWCIVCVSGIIGTSSNCMLNVGTVNFLIYRLKGPHTATLAGSQRCFFCLTSGFFLVLGEMQPFLLVYGTCMWHHWNYFWLAVEDMGAGFFLCFTLPWRWFSIDLGYSTPKEKQLTQLSNIVTYLGIRISRSLWPGP